MNDWESLSDVQLLEHIAEKDRKAFETFYRRHNGRVLGALRRRCRDEALADDILQEVFMGVWRSAGSFSTRRGDVGGWLYTISRNKLFDAFRRAGAGPSFVDMDVSELRTLSAPRASTEKQMTLRQALEKLSVEQREAMTTKYLVGFTCDETCELLDVPLGTLKSRLRAGMARLREVLKPRTVLEVAMGDPRTLARSQRLTSSTGDS